MAVKTSFTPHDFAAILDQYTLGEFVSFKPFDQGADQTNLLLNTTQGQAVLRYYEKRSADYVKFEIEVLHYLAEHSYPSAAPFAKKDGEYFGIYKGKPFALFEFMPGKHNDNHENYLEVAEAIGKLHAITEGYQPSATAARPAHDTAYVWSCAQQSAVKIPSKVESQARLSWLKQQLESVDLPDNLPKGVCHGDTNPSNFLYSNNKLSAVLDFDQATYTWLMYDLANVVYWWTWPDKGELSIEETKKLLTTYEKYRPLSDEEKHHLFDALKLVILTGMGWFMDNDEGYTNAQRKVELLNSMGRDGFYKAVCS